MWGMRWERNDGLYESTNVHEIMCYSILMTFFLFLSLSMMTISMTTHWDLLVNYVPNAHSHWYELSHNGPIGYLC